MPDKPQAWFNLPGHAVVALQGRDCVAFSQAQFMSDVNPLATGDWQWSGWLTSKGRVVALFALLRRDEETVWLLLPDAEPQAFADALRRYVFRSKVAISVRGDLQVAGNLCRGSGGSRDGNAATPVAASAAPTGGVLLEMPGGRGLRIGDEMEEDDPEAVQRWAEADLLHALPRLPESQVAQWTPQQLSLDRLHAFSVKKGCYPGQEIVARTHFLGQAKRGLVLLEGDVPMAVGAEVRSGERALGTVVSAAGHLALAVLPLDRDPGTLAADGATVRERQFSPNG
jgi:folate-binding protein YgfZ